MPEGIRRGRKPGASCTLLLALSLLLHAACGLEAGVEAAGGGATFPLAVDKAGTGSGTVGSSPAGIACGPTCGASYAPGTSVTLTPTPATGSTFTGWSGACSGTAACLVSMSAARTVTATFDAGSDPVDHPLTVSKSGTGSGTVASSPSGIDCGPTCSAGFGSGTSVTLTPTPATGSSFTGWSGACSGTAACSVDMSAARSVTATFDASDTPSFTLAVHKSGSGSGTVASSPSGIDCGSSCSASYGSGTSVTLTPSPASGSTFAGWSGACSGTSACTVSMSAARTATATFEVDVGTEGDGDFVVGPSYTKSPDLVSKGAPAGKSFRFTMDSRNSAIFGGLDSTLLPGNQHPFTRSVEVYVPAKYRDGAVAPFLVLQDGPDVGGVREALDNLTQDSTPAARRLPAFIVISVANGGGDSKGSERGLEYDTMSDRYARFIENEVVPAVLSNPSIKAAYPNLALTKDPWGRATMGCSSGAAAALTMGWFRPDLFRRIITYSGTFVDQQDDDAPEEKAFPLGAWEYHSGLSLIATSEPKPLRIFVNVNQNDLGANAPESDHHNWVMANQRTAAALKSKSYHYRYVFGQGAGHCDGRVRDATLADALVWIWRGYPTN